MCLLGVSELLLPEGDLLGVTLEVLVVDGRGAITVGRVWGVDAILTLLCDGVRGGLGVVAEEAELGSGSICRESSTGEKRRSNDGSTEEPGHVTQADKAELGVTWPCRSSQRPCSFAYECSFGKGRMQRRRRGRRPR